MENSWCHQPIIKSTSELYEIMKRILWNRDMKFKTIIYKMLNMDLKKEEKQNSSNKYKIFESY
jgi:hypothetical protein